jgi:hypothetical protein
LEIAAIRQLASVSRLQVERLSSAAALSAMVAVALPLVGGALPLVAAGSCVLVQVASKARLDQQPLALETA